MTRLALPLGTRGRRRGAEAAFAQSPRVLDPGGIAWIHPGLGKIGIDTALAQFMKDLVRPLSAVSMSAQEGFDEAFVVEEFLVAQCREHFIDDRGVAEALQELLSKLRDAVFTTGEQIECSATDQRDIAGLLGNPAGSEP